MKKQFVSYEIAKQLKELGFDESCIAFYYLFNGEETFLISTISNTNSSWDNGFISAPLWQQVIDWFIEKHGMIILPFMFDEFREDYFSYRIIRRQGNINVHYPYKSYYEAREQAILKAIELCQKEK